MTRESDIERQIDDVFEEVALVLGGLIVLYGANDEFVWRLTESLKVIRNKSLRRLEAHGSDVGRKSPDESKKPRPHPAVEEFIASLGRKR